MLEKKIKRERNSSTKNKIIEILSSSTSALAHKDFQDIMGNSCDRVTIYRALERLFEEGKIHKITNFDGVIVYALCKNCDNHNHIHQDEHIHFSCEKCKTTQCLELNLPKIELPKNYKISQKQFLFSGICPKCS